MSSQQIKTDAIDALVALGHKRHEAQRLVEAAFVRGVNPGSVQDLIRAAYHKPAGAASVASNPLDHMELMQLAKATGSEIGTDAFKVLKGEVDSLQARRGQMTNRAYQEALWAIPAATAQRRAAHFTPARDAKGAPLETTSLEPGSAGAIAGLGAAEVTGMAVPDIPAVLGGMMNRPPLESDSGTFTATSSLDKAQTIADAVGVVDQTGITDLANAGVSLTRAFTEPERAGEHLGNAAMRALSAVPIVGDAAKLVKYGPKAAEAARGGNAAKALGSQGGAAHMPTGGKATFGGGVSAAAQAALQAIGGAAGGAGGGGNIGGGGGTAPPGGQSPGNANNPAGGGNNVTGQQAAQNLSSLGSAIQAFLNGTGAAGATLAAIGHQVYTRALKPLIDWFQAVDDTSRKMLEDNRRLAAYSGTIGAAFQKLDTERFMRDVSKSQDMSGSISKLADAQSRSEQAQQDLFQPYQKLSVEMQTMRTEVIAAILKGIDSIDVIGSFIEWWIGDQRMKDALRNDEERAEEMVDKHLTEKKLKD